MKILALKIYTDTIKGYREGVPRLLDMLNELALEGSFFFAMGAESGASVVSKFFNGLGGGMGGLNEGREIIASAPGIIRDAYRRGQDCGVYGWNAFEWLYRLEKMKDTTLEADIKRAVEYFARRTGARPNGFAAPGFRASYISLRIEDDVRFKYCSDTFGFYPFLPKMSWKTFRTPQVPSTLPPLEVMLSRANEGTVREHLQDLENDLPDGLSVLPMNALVATMPEIIEPLREFLLRCSDRGVKFIHLERVVRSIDIANLPACEVASAKAFGMARDVAVQSLE